jgi:MFS family permease
MNPELPPKHSERWYTGVTRYQWLVLVIASLGWVFDIFEGQVFNVSRDEVMQELIPETARGDRLFYSDVIFAASLVGGAAGGVFFGRMGDRFGRTRTMIWTIVVYSAFSCVSALAETWWQLMACRFLVALGTGGEWAVATALVAEAFSQKARAWSLAIFHASSVLGTLLGAAVGILVVANPNLGWRWAFVLGAGPALLVIWVRWSLRDPPRKAAPALTDASRGTTLTSLFRGPLLQRTLIGVGLATVGLATYWGTHVNGMNVLRGAIVARETQGLGPEAKELRLDELRHYLKQWQMTGMLLVTVGGGAGLVFFGPLSERFGRRGAFLFYHVGGLAAALILFQLLSGVAALVIFLPIFGFLTVGMHAGYAVYFPELFPTALRSTGAGFCFNVGRLVAAPVLVISGWLKQQTVWRLTPDDVASLLSLLFLVGIALLVVAPETRGQELPE